MKSYTEDEFINYLIKGFTIDDKALWNVKYITCGELYFYFHSKYVHSNNPFPIEYNDIKNELMFIRSFYKGNIGFYTSQFYCSIAAVFKCMHNDGIKITNRQLEYIKQNYRRFNNPNEIMDYFVRVYLPYREDFKEYHKIDNMWFRGETLYVRTGHNISLTHEWGFINPNEKEIFDIIDDYKDKGVSGLTYFLIGFYYLNHHKYNLNIYMLKNMLDDYQVILDYMLMNNLDYQRMKDETVLDFFQNSLNKIIIK